MKESNLKTIIITALGATVEWFEFSIFGYLATYLSVLFFPEKSGYTALISIFGIFAASYFTRPFGGFVLASIGDRLGRRYALTLSIGLMCIPMLIMTIIPTYNVIGWWSVAILIFARMIQGFSIGGEYTGVLVIIAESAPYRFRGFFTSLASMTSQFGIILSAVVVGILTTIFTEAQMLDFGWRIAFLIGLLLGVISLFLQHSITESPLFVKVKKKRKTLEHPLLSALKGPKMPFLWVFILTSNAGIAYYMLITFLPNNLIVARHIDINTVMWITVLTSLIYAFVSPLFGWFSDLWGRKIMLYIPIILLLIVAYPIFFWFNNGTIIQIFFAGTIFAILIAAITASFQIIICELFPTEYRYSAVSIAYNSGSALFVGTTPMISLLLIDIFQSSFAPCYYLIITSIITLLTIWKMPETNKSCRVKENLILRAHPQGI
ncbi:MAG: MHS family proline/betaine transporter-like MFS transporter [Candidatus Midichloriaceae bacterium]|jgi:MHS family proline/betaine transporter-like MFS transporter